MPVRGLILPAFALFLAVALIAGIFPDIVYHYYPVDVPQVR